MDTKLGQAASAFWTLFDGRRDCYGKGAGLCVKKPITEELLTRHLAGEVTIGVYPLTPEGTCHWLCIDLDLPDEAEVTRWARALTLYEALRGLGASPFIERSKSKGYHAWVFFREPVEAAWARRLARRALAAAALPPDTEVFPKHDHLSNEVPFGTYVNLPYFGGGGNGRQVMMNPTTGEPWALDEFLDALSPTDPNDVLLGPEAEGDVVIVAGEPEAAPLLGEDAAYGQRHSKSKRVIGLLARRLWVDGEQAILDTARNWNLAHCKPSLPEAEVRNMVRDFWRKEEAKQAKQNLATEAEPLQADTLETLLADEDEALDAVIGDGGEGAVLTADGKGFVAGPTGVGKTNLLLHLSRCLCEATPFLGLPVNQARRVLYIMLEGSRRGIRRRLRKVWTDTSEEARARFSLAFTRLDIGRKEDLERLRALVSRVQPEVLIIDPLRNIHPWDENASDTAAHLTALLDEIIASFGCAIVAAHHDRKRPPFVRRDIGTDRVRGSTALTGWLSFCLSLDTDPQETDTLLAEWTKTRDAEALLPPLSLRFNRDTLDFTASERQAGGKVSDDAILGAIFHAGGRIKGTELIRGLVEGAGAGERAIRTRLRLLVKDGRLLEYVAPDDKRTRAKSYALPREDTEENE